MMSIVTSADVLLFTDETHHELETRRTSLRLAGAQRPLTHGSNIHCAIEKPENCNTLPVAPWHGAATGHIIGPKKKRKIRESKRHHHSGIKTEEPPACTFDGANAVREKNNVEDKVPFCVLMNIIPRELTHIIVGQFHLASMALNGACCSSCLAEKRPGTHFLTCHIASSYFVKPSQHSLAASPKTVDNPRRHLATCRGISLVPGQLTVLPPGRGGDTVRCLHISHL